ncbi:MAG: hypothetical protein JXA42_10870 [Anaerolineales bacterium]|nr:hypothetical protein [Anaerolineales bacterium]
MPNQTLLPTKLHRSPLPASWVQRPPLIQRLNQGLALNRPVTLVSAPAGFGKSTCISEWVNTLSDRPVSWLSLDPSDDDPRRFFAYLIAALQKVDPALGREIESVLDAGQLPPHDVISAALINDILDVASPFILVLDDFHAIQDRFILQVLEQLVANLPPPLHLVLITREDPSLPLARFRANNRLTEIRAMDLRFTGPDAGRFLNDRMNLSLAPADVAELALKTEGWIAGLQLAALAMQSLAMQAPHTDLDQSDPSGFIANLSGSHRFILSYLTEQVLDRQPQEIRQFLLQTSILDKLNGDLCNMVTGRTDGHALLEQLYNANLFLIPLDDEGQWYRYHHLFADLLRAQQNRQGETSELHRRAACWYAVVQDGGTFTSEAIGHALAAQDYAMVVDLLESYAMGMIMQGYAKTVNNWVQALPAEWASSPRTSLAFAWMHLLQGAYPQAAAYMERLEGVFTDPQVSWQDRQSLKAEWLVLRALFLNVEGDIKASIALVDEALEITPEEDSRVLSLAYFGRACACQVLDEYDRVVESYQQAIQHGRAAGNLVAEMLGISGLCSLAFEHGQLHLAFEIATPVCDRLEGSNSFPPISTVVFGVPGQVYYEWNQTGRARRYYQRALQLSTLGGLNSGMTNCRVLLSRLSLLEGDIETAEQEIRQAGELLQVDTPQYVRQELVAQQVRVNLARNQLGAAELALKAYGFSFRDRFTYPGIAAGQTVAYSIGLLYNSSLQVLLHQAREWRSRADLDSGIEFAGRVIDSALRGQYIPIALGALLLRSQMHALLGNRQAGQADLTRALGMGEQEGFIAIFVEQGSMVAREMENLLHRKLIEPVRPEYVERILAAFSPTLTPDRPAAGELLLVEPLTGRELDVLRLMAQGLKYKEIASQLFISLNTVRYHVKAIYEKLAVNNRTQAIQRAQQLEIL